MHNSTNSKYLAVVLYSKSSWLEKSLIDIIDKLYKPNLEPELTNSLISLRKEKKTLKGSLKSQYSILKEQLENKNIATIFLIDHTEAEYFLQLDVSSIEDFKASGLVNKFILYFPYSQDLLNLILPKVKEVFRELDCVYGFVQLFGKFDRSQLRHYLNNISTNILDELANNDCKAWYRNQEYCDEYIRDTYWGNILTTKHMDKLGGLENILKKVKQLGEEMEEWGENTIFIKSSVDNNTYKKVEFLKSLVVPNEWLGAK